MVKLLHSLILGRAKAMILSALANEQNTFFWKSQKPEGIGMLSKVQRDTFSKIRSKTQTIQLFEKKHV